MMGVGFGEMVLIAGIALVVIGPEKFPEFAKIVLRTFRDLRGYVEDAKRDIAEELRPVKREMQQLSRHSPEEFLESLAESGSHDKENAGEEEKETPSASPSSGDAAYSQASEDSREEARTEAPDAPDNSQDEFWADVEADSDSSASSSGGAEDPLGPAD